MLAKVPNIKNVNVVIENIKETQAKETQARVKRATEAGEAAARRAEADAKQKFYGTLTDIREAATGRPIRKNINRGDSDPDAKLGKTKRVLGSSAATNKEFEDIKERARRAAYNKVFKQEVPIKKVSLEMQRANII